MCKWGLYEILELKVPADLSHTGKSYIKKCQIDKCIAPLIKAINDAGIYTRACCCGHNNTFGNIVLEDGRELLICPDFKTARKMENFSKVNIHGELKSKVGKNE